MGVFTTVKPSRPVYAVGLPEDMDDWTCQNWITYHQRMTQKLALWYANQLIQTDAERVGWFANIHSCKYNCGFVNYFQSKGIKDIGNIFSKLYCTASNVVTTTGDTITNAVDNVGNVITNVTKTASSITKPSFLIAGGVAVGLYFLNKYENGKRKKR